MRPGIKFRGGDHLTGGLQGSGIVSFRKSHFEGLYAIFRAWGFISREEQWHSVQKDPAKGKKGESRSDQNNLFPEKISTKRDLSHQMRRVKVVT